MASTINYLSNKLLTCDTRPALWYYYHRVQTFRLLSDFSFTRNKHHLIIIDNNSMIYNAQGATHKSHSFKVTNRFRTHYSHVLIISLLLRVSTFKFFGI